MRKLRELWRQHHELKLSNRAIARGLSMSSSTVSDYRQQACLEEIDYSHARGLTKAQVLELSTSRWVADKQNVLLSGPTGVGKSFLACALGQKACRDGYSVVYRRASRLFDELAQARADGTRPHVLKRLAKAQVLILDDFGLEPLGSAERKELLEVLEDRYQQSSTVVTS